MSFETMSSEENVHLLSRPKEIERATDDEGSPRVNPSIPFTLSSECLGVPCVFSFVLCVLCVCASIGKFSKRSVQLLGALWESVLV